MNKTRIALVFILVAAMSLSMFFAPMAPVRQAETNTPPVFTPEQLEQIEDFYSVVDQPSFKPEVDTLLAEWQAGVDISDEVVMWDDKPSVLIYGSPNLDIDAIREIVEIDWWVNMRAFLVVKAHLPSTTALDAVVQVDGVATVAADEKAFDSNDLEKVIDKAPGDTYGVDMEAVNALVNADSGAAASYDGTGITVGHVDTGADFGHPALQDAYDMNSYDPTGYGLVPTYYHGNTTAVANVTEWLMEGNVLTYVEGGKTYVNVTGWDPVLNNNGGPRHLLGLLPPYGNGYPYGPVVGFIGLYEWAWGPNNVSEFVYNEMWMDWEIPDASEVQGNYSFGWTFQQRNGPYAKMFAPMLVYNGTDDNHHVIVDWEGTEAWNAMWNGAVYYEGLDLNDTADRATITGLMDWNFTDDWEDGDFYDATNPIVAEDLTGDGIDDLSLGALCWTFDPGFFDDEPVFWGFRSDGDAVALYFDHGTHGTATAAHVAARDIGQTYYQPDNNWTDVVFEGVAPGSEIISVAAITAGADMSGSLWICGFDYNATSQEFYYTGNHQSDLTTNSWGWITEPSSEFNYLAMTWTILSVPDYLDDSFDGVLNVFSAGNEGHGYMTISPPGATTACLTVGASTSSAWLEFLYGPTQNIEAIASFSSRGPAFSGYPKPDVLAPGSADYTANPWYAQYMQMYWEAGPYWGATVYNTTLFGGTSQAAPIAAGVAALVMEAAADNDPATTKAIVQYTADVMGYDPAIEGFGRVNADAACSYAEGTSGIIGMSTDSYNNLAAAMDDAWESWGIIGNLGADVNQTTYPDHPRDFSEGALFFGWVMPGDSVTIHYSAYDNTGTMITDTSGITEDAWELNLGEQHTFTDTTFSYNDTVVFDWPDSQMYGYYNLREELGAAAYDANMSAYSYVTVTVAFNATEVAGAEPWMFMYDWTDTDPNDGMPNLWNATSGEGDELERITNAGLPSNVNSMVFADATTTLDAALDGNLTIVIHDPIHDVNMTAPGHEFTCTVTFWEWTDIDSQFTFTDDASDTYTYNITLDVPAGADPGIHQGFVTWDTFRTVPFSYNVVQNLTGDAGDVHTMVDGFGDALQPYDNPTYGAMGYDTGAWDYRSFVVYNKHATAGHLGVRAIWEDAGADMYVEILNNVSFTLAEGGALTDTTTAVIADLPANPVGYYYVMVHPEALSGFEEMPANYTLEVIWYEDLTNKDIELTYTANDLAMDTFADGDTLTGDHVVVNATYPDFNLDNMPEFEIVGQTISFLSGVYYEETGTLIIPDSSYDPFSGAIDTSQFAWEYVAGVKSGDTVDIEVDFTNGDCDIMVWYYSIDGTIQDNSTWTYANNLVEDQMATGAHPEVGQFNADFTGDVATLAVGVFDYDLQSGEYTVIVDTRVGVDETAAGQTVTFDTYDLLKNGTFQIKVYSWTETNLDYTVNLAGVTFNNFFSPVIENVTVAGTGAEKTITWDISDQNAGDEHFFEIQLSADSGTTWQLVATNLDDDALSYTWDSTGFLDRDTYKVRVTVFDNDPNEAPNAASTGVYWMGLSDSAESDVFSAGTETETTPTTTTTTTTTQAPPPVIDPLWIGLIGGIGVGVVVVLILFLVKRR